MMSDIEIFESCLRTKGDLAGVFEYDGETGYFYLYDANQGHGEKVLGSIHVLTGDPDFSDADVSVRWSIQENKVGLFIKGVLWAAFEGGSLLKHGGDYRAGAKPALAAGIRDEFGTGARE